MKTNAGKDMEQGDSLLLQVHSCTAMWKAILSLQEIENQSISRPTYTTLVYNTKRSFRKDSFSSMFTVTFHSSQKMYL